MNLLEKGYIWQMDMEFLFAKAGYQKNDHDEWGRKSYIAQRRRI